MSSHRFMGDRKIQNIVCIGGGYVGGPSAAVIANKAPHVQVTVVDIDARRIAAWNSDTLPVYEPNLFELVQPARDGYGDREPNLFFSTEIDQKVAEADIVFIGVNTPTKKTGLGAGKASDLSWLEAATRRVAKAAVRDTIVVEKSTVPCGTADMMRQILRANARADVRFEVLSNPEFLAEGTAVSNLLNPDRILIGCMETETGYAAAHALADIYASWIPRHRLITMNLWSSELSKLAANAMLAQRISSINALSSICERVDANIQDVSYAVGLDTRIGPRMLNSSVGFGGSCFKKDVMNLVYISESLGLPEVAQYFQGIIEVNEYQMARFVRNIVNTMHSTLSGKKMAVLGFAYKKDTGDTRESPAITVVQRLLAENAVVHIYDPPVRREQIYQDLKVTTDDERVAVCDDPYAACEDAHAVVILTEWDMFVNKLPKNRSNNKTTTSAIPVRPALGSTSTPTAPTTTNTATTGGLSSPAASESGSSVHDMHHDAVFSSAVSSTTDLTCPSPFLPGGDDKSSSKETLLPSVTSGGDRMTTMTTTTTTTTAVEEAHSTSTKQRPAKLDWSRVVRSMNRPAHVFDGRNTLDIPTMQHLGFTVEAIGVSSTPRYVPS